MLTLTWNKAAGGQWASFERIDLSHAHFTNMAGVYVIWHAGQSPATVRVGQGDIADRLRAHREDREITKYAAHGLFVTWARVDARYHDGVERFIAEQLRPLVGDRFPDVPPLEVNLPW